MRVDVLLTERIATGHTAQPSEPLKLADGGDTHIDRVRAGSVDFPPDALDG
jgi:hypothetical protein